MRTLRQKFVRLSRPACYLLLLAFICNALTPAFAGQLNSTNKVLLCTSQGFEWVELEQAQLGSEPVEQHCVYCTAPNDDPVPDQLDLVDAIQFYAQSQQVYPASLTTAALQQQLAFFTDSRAPPPSHA